MPATLHIDLIEGASHSRRYGEDGRITDAASRIAVICGVSLIADKAGALLQARALAEATVPRGTPYGSGSYAIALSYNVQGISTDDDSVRIEIGYETPFADGSGGGEPVWMIEDDSEDELEETQIDPATGNELEVVWTNPANAAQTKQDIATVRLRTTVRKVVLTGILTNAQLKTYRDAEGSVNDALFDDDPEGWWWFKALRTRTRPGAAFWYATVELMRKENDFSTYFVFRDPDGKFVLPGPGVLAGLRNGPYQYGVQKANGVLKIGGMKMKSFSSLFNITL